MARWAEAVGRGERVTDDAVTLRPALLAEDALIFGLRMNAGVDLAASRARWPEAPWAEFEARLNRLEEAGLVQRADDWIRLTGRGRLLADSVGAEVMAA